MPEFRKVVRKERAVLDEEWIIKYLEESKYGFLGLADGSQPYINPLLFIYESPNLIYFHTKRNSYTQSIIMNNAIGCFCVAEMGNLVSSKKAVDFTTEYKSVTLFGPIEPVEVHDEIMRIFNEYFIKYFPQVDKNSYDPFTIHDANRAILFKMLINEWSAKQNPNQMV